MCLLKENLIKCNRDNLSKKTATEGYPLAKWKLFNWFKKKEQSHAEKVITTEEKTESDEKQDKPETREKQTETPIKEYDETLYSKGSEQKQPSKASPEKRRPLKRTSWENADTIEENIDGMRRNQTQSSACDDQDKKDIDKKVDYILLKKKSRL